MSKEKKPKKQPTKPNSGQFVPGNTIGMETRFQLGNNKSNKYQDKYCYEMLAYFLDSDVVFPMFEDYACRIGVVSSTLLNWCEKHPRFKDSYARCKEIQKQRLLVGGLIERFNPQIVKFIAINDMGMKEKVEQEVKADTTFKVNISFFEE